MDIAVRRQLAKQFANVPSAPHQLIQHLANDEFSVARDVLLKSTVLKEQRRRDRWMTKGRWVI